MQVMPYLTGNSCKRKALHPHSYRRYMFGYEGTRRALLREGETVRDLDMARLFIAGGVGGLCAQLSSLPCDVVKTKIQVRAEKEIQPCSCQSHDGV